MTTRLSVNINDDSAEFLRESAERRSTSITEVVRRATSFYYLWANEVEDGNKTAIVEDDDGNRQVVLPVF